MKRKKSVYSSSLQKKMEAERNDRRQVYGVLAGLALVAGILVLVGYGVYSGLCHSAFFQVESISVKGSSRYSADEIVAKAGLDNKSNLVAVSQKEINKSLQTTGWVKKVEVDKKWPNGISLLVQERKPVAMIQVDGVMSYVDSGGKVFAPVAVDDDLDYPVLFVPNTKVLADQQAMKGPLDMLRYASSGNPDLSKQNISQLVLDEDGALTMYLADNPFPVILGKNKMWSKYKRLTRVLAWLYEKRKFNNVASIDMEYLEGRVLVKFNG